MKKHPDVKEVVVFWECSIRKELAEKKDLQDMKKEYPPEDFERLSLRSAFKGGLCLIGAMYFNSSQLRSTLEEFYPPGTVIPDCTATFVDITSQYPSYLLNENVSGYFETAEDRLVVDANLTKAFFIFYIRISISIYFYLFTLLTPSRSSPTG